MTMKAVTKSRDVAQGQLNQIRKMSQDKGIDHTLFQQGLDDGSIAVALDAIKTSKRLVMVPRLLRQVSTVPVSGYEKFVAKDHFTKDDSQVRFWYFGDNFTNHFLPKVEGPCVPATLAVHQLQEASLDDPIRQELGDRQEITLGQFYQFLATQDSGWFIAYIRDAKSNLWAVRAYWDAGCGWRVSAYSVTHPHGWGPVPQVVSRK